MVIWLKKSYNMEEPVLMRLTNLPGQGSVMNSPSWVNIKDYDYLEVHTYCDKHYKLCVFMN